MDAADIVGRIWKWRSDAGGDAEILYFRRIKLLN